MLLTSCSSRLLHVTESKGGCVCVCVCEGAVIGQGQLMSVCLCWYEHANVCIPAQVCASLKPRFACQERRKSCSCWTESHSKHVCAYVCVRVCVPVENLSAWIGRGPPSRNSLVTTTSVALSQPLDKGHYTQDDGRRPRTRFCRQWTSHVGFQGYAVTLVFILRKQRLNLL